MSTEPALTAPWQHLERLIARDARVLVPVLGSGFVTQAAAAGASHSTTVQPVATPHEAVSCLAKLATLVA